MTKGMINDKNKMLVIAIISIAVLLVIILSVFLFISANNANRGIDLEVTDMPARTGPSMATADDLKFQAAAALNNKETDKAIGLYKSAYEQFLKLNSDEADVVKAKLCHLGEQEYCGTESR